MNSKIATKGMEVNDKIDYYTIKTDSCWLWKSYHNHKGYPVLNVRTFIRRVCRLQYERYNNRKLLKTECVLHSCDNKGCINPEHLKAGSDLDNKKEMFERGLLTKDKLTGLFQSTKEKSNA